MAGRVSLALSLRCIARLASYTSISIIPGAATIDLRGAASRGVLLVHGFGDSPASLRYLAADLHAHGYDVRAPLLPGHGRDMAAFDAVRHAEWLSSVKAEILAMRARMPWVGVVGLSMGGALSAILASEIRDIPSLVLLAPYLGMPRHMQLAAATSRLWAGVVGEISSASSASVHDPQERGQGVSYAHVTGHALHELWCVMRMARRALPSVKTPTLLLQSREDNRVAAHVAEDGFARLGAAEKRLVFVEGAGHVLTVDYGKERVFDEVRAWLGGGPGTAPPTTSR